MDSPAKCRHYNAPPAPGSAFCAVHWLARVMLPAELDALGWHTFADERETGVGTLNELRAALDLAESAVAAGANGPAVLYAAFRAAAEPRPRTGPRPAISALTNIIQRVRSLRFVRDGAALPKLAPVAISETHPEEEYVNPRLRVIRGGRA
jgi:hypothetical protein